MATKKTLGYRFHIRYGGHQESSPYPGYKTREECETAALRCKHFVEDKRGAYNVSLRFEETFSYEDDKKAQ